MRTINYFIRLLYRLSPIIFIGSLLYNLSFETEDRSKTISSDIAIISGSMIFSIILLYISSFFHITKIPHDLEIDNESYETISNTNNAWHFIIASEIIIYEMFQVVFSIYSVLEVSDYYKINWYITFTPTLIFIFTRPLKRLNELKK